MRNYILYFLNFLTGSFLLYYISSNYFNRHDKAIKKAIFVSIIATILNRIPALLIDESSFHAPTLTAIFGVIMIIPIAILVKKVYSFSFDAMVKCVFYVGVSSFVVNMMLSMLIGNIF